MKIGKSFSTILLVASSVLGPIQASASALPTDRPLNVVVFGDSVTRGTMADAQMGKPNARFYADMLRGRVVISFYTLLGKLFGVPNPSEDDIGFIEKNFSHMSRLSLSAFVGNQPYSLPKHIENATSYRPKIYNGAILAAGYRTSDIPLTRFERHQRNDRNAQNPDVVVVNFNGIDFINNVPVETFTKDVARFFKRLKKLAPAATVFVTEISDPIPILTAPNRIAAPANLLMPKELTCHDLYRQLRFGAQAGLSPDSTSEEISAASDRLFEMRTILADQIDLANADYEGGKIVLIKNVLGQDGVDPVELLAADCIHPNVAGQKLIGETIWNAISDYFY